MRVAVYTIAKNEAWCIPRWAESCQEADIRLIVDTGSADSTLETAHKCGCQTASISIVPWRFDDARNAALALLPADVDWCISLDADEVLLPGWRQALEQAPAEATKIKYRYVWNFKNGQPDRVFHADHIHRRSAYRWKSPCHEYLHPVVAENIQVIEGLEIHHHADQTKSRGQYLELLKLAVAEAPSDTRMAFYFARELFFHGHHDASANHFRRFLSLPNAWSAERCSAHRFMAKIDPKNAIHWLLCAISQEPGRREAWVELASLYARNGMWAECLGAATAAARIQDRSTDYLTESFAWGDLPEKLKELALMKISYPA